MSKFFEKYHPDFDAIITTESELSCLATNLGFTEGPAWLESQNSLLFTDIPNNRILRWQDREGLSVWNDNSHFAIGLHRDALGRILACEHTTRRLVRYELNQKVTVLTESYQSRVLNSPNDVTVRSDGVIFFTDPPFGVRIEDRELIGYQQAMEQAGCYVFRVTTDPSAPIPVITNLYRPNGLVFSPDERRLYVSDSSERYHRVYVYDMINDMPSNRQVFCLINAGVPDGMRVDTKGRLYVSSLDGINIFSSTGILLGRLNVPEMVTNCCFGGSDKQILYITATHSLYAIKLAATGFLHVTDFAAAYKR